MRIAISSSSFRRPLALRELTQLEWVERCATVLEADGIVAAVVDFPRADDEYVAQLRKVTIDLGLVPFGLDAPALLDPTAAPGSLQHVLALANAFGAAVVRTVLPAPGEIPPASFVEAVAAAKEASRAAKAANVTLVVAAAPGTLGEDLGGVKHLLKDVDSAWLRACPAALTDPAEISTKDRFPVLAATTADDPARVAAAARSAWVIVDAPGAELPLDDLAVYVGALRDAQAEGRLSRR
jgi:sugar phosphate isomerase/epimerase